MRAQRATPRIGGTAKERKTGRPQRPEMKPGADDARPFSDNEDEMRARGREYFLRSSPRKRGPRSPIHGLTMKDWVPACAGTNGGETRTRMALGRDSAVHALPRDLILEPADDHVGDLAFRHAGGAPHVAALRIDARLLGASVLH